MVERKSNAGKGGCCLKNVLVFIRVPNKAKPAIYAVFTEWFDFSVCTLGTPLSLQ